MRKDTRGYLQLRRIPGSLKLEWHVFLVPPGYRPTAYDLPYARCGNLHKALIYTGRVVAGIRKQAENDAEPSFPHHHPEQFYG